MVSIFGLAYNDLDYVEQNIDLNSKTIKNVAEPQDDADVATKHYVDSKITASSVDKLPTTQFTFPSATNNSGGYAWTDFVVIPSGFTEAQFLALPSGFYACYTSHLPSMMRGSLPSQTKGFLTCYVYQNGANKVYNKRYTWCSNAINTSDIYVASVRENTWFTWILQTPVLTSGENPMRGNLNMLDNKIINVFDPVESQDVATKNYVDENTIPLSRDKVPILTDY
jgi:hypothetical protein